MPNSASSNGSAAKGAAKNGHHPFDGQAKPEVNPLRVLLVEDDEDDATFETRELKRVGAELVIKHVDSLKDVGKALDSEKWDLVISDHALPGFGSLEVLGQVRQRGLDIPFIIVSGTIGEDVAVAAMKAGANDYVMKGQLGRLVPSVQRELREAESRRARRRAEDALHQSQQDLNDFFEHATIGLSWVGPHGEILRANETELQTMGYSSKEYTGHSLSEFILDNGAAKLMQRLHKGEEIKDVKVCVRCKNGSVKQLLVSANVLWDGKNFVHARFCNRDITERRQGEAARSYLAAIVESSDDAIIGTTLDGTVLSWNDGAKAMYGYDAEQIVGSPMAKLVPRYLPEEWAQIYERIKAGERIERYETTRQRKDGTSLDVSLSLSPIKDRSGKVVGVSAIERDITARKKEEEERVKLIAELTDALGKIKTLRGLLPICASCKKIRDDRGYWKKIEAYISEHTQAEFTHGICPDCMTRLYPQYTLKK